MAVTYKPSRQMNGPDAQAILFELRKIQQKLNDLESRVAALEAP